jgi:replication-associated recombination protein RarA
MNKNYLLWEKYRPNNLNNIILLPRIREFVDKGIQTNLIFYGGAGTGKTSLARILAADHHTLEINASLDTSVEMVRTNIYEHISTLNFQYSPDQHKVVILDEFDKASAAFQDALKGFIETYHKQARFIVTTNHINKITEMGSRYNKVNFDPINQTEIDYLKTSYNKYLTILVKAIKEDELIPDTVITKIINKFFPDLRSAVQMVQEIQISRNGDRLETSSASSHQIDLYNFIFDTNVNSIDIYKYVLSNYIDNYEKAFNLLGRPFFIYLMEFKPEIALKNAVQIFEVQKNYNASLTLTIDPVIHLICYIQDLKKCVN